MRKTFISMLLAAALVLCMLSGCAGGGDKPDETAQTEEAKTMTAQDFFWLAAENRFDCVPLFDEGSAPKTSDEYLMYAFIMNEEPLKSNMDGYVVMPASLVDETAEKYFGVTSLAHASDEGMWVYDGAAGEYTATGWGYANEPSYIMEDCTAEETEAGTVYTVSCRTLAAEEFDGMELSPYFIIDFTENDYDSGGLRALNALIKDSGLYKEGMTYGEALTALMDAGRTGEIPVSSRLLTYKFRMEDGHPVFLAHGEDGGEEMTAERFFEMAIDERFDYVPYFDEGDAPQRAGDYLMYTFILNEEPLKQRAEDYVKMPAALVDETAERYFGVTGLSHESFEGLWDYDAATDEYTATGWGYANERIYVMQSLDTEQRGGRTIYTVLAAPADIEEFDVMMTPDMTLDEADYEDDAYPSEELSSLNTLIYENGVYRQGVTYREAVAELIRQGRGGDIPLAYEQDRFVFYMEDGHPVFLGHYTAYGD